MTVCVFFTSLLILGYWR